MYTDPWLLSNGILTWQKGLGSSVGFIFIFIYLATGLVGSYFTPVQRSNHTPLPWKRGALTPGSPGKSL